MALEELNKKHLIRNFFDLKAKLGRQPTCLEYAKRTGHSITSLRKYFGSPGWSSFLQSIGRVPKQHSGVTRGHLIRHYRDLKTRLGRTPTKEEFYTRCHSYASVRKHFGLMAWERLQKASGEKLPPAKKKRLPATRIRREKITAGHLIQDFLELQKELGRCPRIVEFQKRHHTNKVIIKAFGGKGWRELLKAIGDRMLPQIHKLSREHLIGDYRDLCGKLGREPVYKEFSKRYHSLNALNRVFGTPGWRNLIEAVKAGR